MAEHPPAARRAVIRHLKDGEHPSELIDDARSIRDPAHAAAAMLHLAADDRLPAGKAAALVRDATDRLTNVDRPGRMAEAWGDVLEVAVMLDRGPETTAAVERLQSAAVDALRNLPDGQWVTDTAIALADKVDAYGRRVLLDRALGNPGGELEAAKVLLAVDPTLEDMVRDAAPPEVATRVLAKTEGADSDEAVAAAWAIADLAKRREALRVLATKLDDADRLMDLGRSSKGRDLAEQVACWTLVGARLDRLSLDPAPAFDHASRILGGVSGKEAVKAHRKLSQAMERSGLDAPPAPDASMSSASHDDSVDIPINALSHHAFALVDGYSGGLGTPHLRAVARAAPLCVAFDLDLVLMGFPTDDLGSLVDLVDAESNVGEGEGYARRLFEADRLHLMPLTDGLPAVWPGTPVATTPHPATGKATALRGVDGPLCLLIGQGKQGLPKRMLAAVGHHHELTGRGISMETATAMGILADRLGRIQV